MASDTRNAAAAKLAAITQSLSELSARTAQGLSDLSARTAAVEAMYHNQTLLSERTNASLDRIFETLDKLQEGRLMERQAEKRPEELTDVENHTTTLTNTTTPPLNKLLVNQCQSTRQQGFESQHFNLVRRSRADAPTFNGDAVDGWIFQMERYFEQQGTPPEHKLAVATSYITGEALDWYQFMHTTHQLINWESFVSDLKARFGPSPYENPKVTLSKLRQTASVVAYAAEYETLSTGTPGFSSSNLLHLFLGGLRDEVHQELIDGRRCTRQK